jgi:uncharacterized membrane protein YedE/YeeE
MRSLLTMVLGVALGFVMSRIGFTSWDDVHGMFTFTDFRLLLAFMTSVAVLAVGWIVVGKLTSRGLAYAPRVMHPGILGGGALFGVGWALTGACPTSALVQVGEGQLAALCTVGGIIVGNWVYAVVHERYFRWPAISCADE